ncbi:MAG: ATP-dependent Clp protease adaptor ClpS [Elusimicrobia bacterium]|nr:ATP-dependent Clp protease adaptor ClpS [Elusimicrobiota bacterium]
MPPAILERKAHKKQTADTSQSGFEWKTILLNCSCHSFDEVERQLIKAIRCSLARARQISWEVHSRGSALVFTGPQERCEAVAGVLEDIGLLVKVSQ